MSCQLVFIAAMLSQLGYFSTTFLANMAGIEPMKNCGLRIVPGMASQSDSLCQLFLHGHCSRVFFMTVLAQLYGCLLTQHKVECLLTQHKVECLLTQHKVE